MRSNLFTSESVTEGHPDKMCDAISDAVLDAHLRVDPYSRVACEVCASKKNVMVMGEITSKAKVDIDKIVRDTINRIGYDKDEYLFNGNSINIIKDLSGQSEDIALGVDNSKETKNHEMESNLGAGDQGMMFGYASNEIESVLMPAAIYYAHELSKKLTKVRKDGTIPYLRPDGKTQVTVKYIDGKLDSIDTIVVSAQHNPGISENKIFDDIKENVILPIIPENLLNDDTKYFVNPTGSFVIGGPAGDSGLTGRKIVVDTYGGYAPHGGGAFSGKDATKVDRSAAYYARYVAKHLVAANLCDKVEIEVAYAIGVAKPVSIMINTFGTGKYDDEKLLSIIEENFDFRPSNIIEELDLRKPVFSKTSAYGHFGNPEFAWEKTPKLELLKKY